ncbi:class I SAM-dependent methyltransferase [Thiohalomonas denitrificans]|uniref:Methyltransferase domain-containing protein n=1 Tax=Thiohalomonas denitrificans TaxID=415747 RepID=A0A1G5QUP2_9GAMM|nr:class I SAM-dependent methyltransferase [Thiohalomonas denitrificans]SCZ65290.1 Methyltransferase domain-containing protein [Thiohalomonas denitrificans]
MEEQEARQRVRATFDAVSDAYDCQPLRFFQRAAECLPGIFDFNGNESVLDAAAGTGIPALVMAPHLPRGSVTAVDLSEGMLAQAETKCRAADIDNIGFRPMDMTAMDFDDGAFDAANCSFGVFFVEDMAGTLRHIASKVKPGGSVVTTHFREGSFGQLTELLGNRIEAYGLPKPPPGWQRVATEAQNLALFEAAGLKGVEVSRHDLGYFLEDAQQWWEVVWNAGYRGLISSLDDQQLAQFKREHLEEVAGLAGPEGIRLDIEVLITKGTRP